MTDDMDISYIGMLIEWQVYMNLAYICRWRRKGNVYIKWYMPSLTTIAFWLYLMLMYEFACALFLLFN